ncbi:restriction endonuclease subunit S [Glutamicibacter soli]
MSLKPYAEYKDSGVEWLGEVPYEWEVSRLKNSVQEAKNGVWGSDPDGSELDLRCVRVADFDRSRQSIHDRNSTLRRVSLDDRKGRILEKGDLLLEKSGGGEKSPVGFVVLYDREEPAVCSNFVARIVIRPGMDSRFWTYVHSMFYSLRLTQRSIKQATGIQNLDQTSYFNELVALPPYTVQCDIADYLDQETAEIDAFIADQEELIALLAERRTATITQAVTKGLDPDAPVKDSGNQWIAALPAHWAVTAMKHLTELQTGVTLGKTYSEDAEEYPYLRVANVQVGYVDLSTLKTVQVTKEVAKRSMLRPGDVLMTEGGDRDKLGRGCIWDAQVQPCLHQNHVFAVRCSEQLSNAFLVYVLDSQVARNYFNVTAKQTTNLAATNSTLVKNFRFGLPPLTEQHDILAYLDRETAEIDAAIADAREAIALSKERRAAVISAAVTGKIDVRGLVAPATSNVEAESVGIA